MISNPTVAILVFLAGAAATVWGGVRLSRLGDILADRTRWGEALFGTVLLGAATSLSGLVMTAAAGLDGRAGLAYSNAAGGLAAQTAALAVADLFYRRANLEHAAASLFNMVSGVVLIMLLALAAGLTFMPSLSIAHVHVGTPIMVAVYLFGLRYMRRAAAEPQWYPARTPATRLDEPAADADSRSVRQLLLTFGGVAAVVSVGGWAVAEAAGVLVEQTPLTETQTGALLMGVTNALPETVVAVAAVRRGALTLAVAGILGGNAFDVLNLAIGDIAFRGGSLYHTASGEQLLILLATMFMTAVVVAGQLRREPVGPGRIGQESAIVLAVYVLTVVLIAT